MLFSKSMTFDGEDINGASRAASPNSVNSIGDLEFVEKLIAGDQAAFNDLVNRYSASVYNLLFRLTGDAEEARDLTQDTFLRALRAIGKFRGDANLKTWLYRIAVNESHNRHRWWRRRRKSSTLSLDDGFNNSDACLSDVIADQTANPEEELLRREREQNIYKALAELSDNLRAAVILRDIEGLTYEEISTALKTNVGTVKSRIARGREELRKKLSA